MFKKINIKAMLIIPILMGITGEKAQSFTRDDCNDIKRRCEQLTDRLNLTIACNKAWNNPRLQGLSSVELQSIKEACYSTRCNGAEIECFKYIK